MEITKLNRKKTPYKVIAICPGPVCKLPDRLHEVWLDVPYTGHNVMKKFCTKCRYRINHDPDNRLL